MIKTPEGIVLATCIKTLKQLEIQGKITHWDRMQVGLSLNVSGYYQKQGRNGSADLWCFVPVDDVMWVLFFEVKRPNGGVQSKVQKEFESKWFKYENVMYSIITNCNEIIYLIECIRKQSKNYGKINRDDLPEEVG